MTEDRKYIWFWFETGTGKSSGASSFTMVAMKEFGETGQYTQEECSLLNKIKNELPCPEWLEWDMFWDEEKQTFHYTADDNRRMAREYNDLIMNRFNESCKNNSE